MLSRLRRTVRRFFNKSRQINHEPINKVSLIVIIIVDLFILFNVFAGLDDISRWPLNPQQTYPCQSSWHAYRQSIADNKDYDIIRQAISPDDPLFQQGQWGYTQLAEGYLGNVSEVCLAYEQAQADIDTSENKQLAKRINDVQAEVSSFETKNATIRQQYDSTLLEDIAGQPREQSINNVAAADAKAEIERNDRAISQRKNTLEDLSSALLNKPESQAFLALLNDGAQFATVENGYSRASFWYPSIQLFFQGLFLLPLIVLASVVHRTAQRKHYGYVALISWHLLVIFWIPLIWKLFEFMQIGFIFEWLLEIVEVLFGGLRFLLNYLNILLIPLIGFAIIKFFQKVVFNTRLQAANRVQKMRCVRCAKKIRKHDIYCPHCSYAQYHVCQNCGSLTYRHLPHCKHCGADQPLDL
ncbi:MAG: hypothetical protein AAF703_09975 [Cyanobacteria bacterium P01_D01_bin.105]